MVLSPFTATQPHKPPKPLHSVSMCPKEATPWRAHLLLRGFGVLQAKHLRGGLFIQLGLANANSSPPVDTRKSSDTTIHKIYYGSTIIIGYTVRSSAAACGTANYIIRLLSSAVACSSQFWRLLHAEVGARFLHPIPPQQAGGPRSARGAAAVHHGAAVEEEKPCNSEKRRWKKKDVGHGPTMSN